MGGGGGGGGWGPPPPPPPPPCVLKKKVLLEHIGLMSTIALAAASSSLQVSMTILSQWKPTSMLLIHIHCSFTYTVHDL